MDFVNLLKTAVGLLEAAITAKCDAEANVSLIRQTRAADAYMKYKRAIAHLLDVLVVHDDPFVKTQLELAFIEAEEMRRLATTELPADNTGLGNLKRRFNSGLSPAPAPTSAPQPSTAQNSAAQHSAAQNSAAQHSAAQNSAAQNSAAQHSAAQHSAAQNSAAQNSAAQNSATQHSADQNSAAQHSAPAPALSKKGFKIGDNVVCVLHKNLPEFNQNFVITDIQKTPNDSIILKGMYKGKLVSYAEKFCHESETPAGPQPAGPQPAGIELEQKRKGLQYGNLQSGGKRTRRKYKRNKTRKLIA